MGIYPYVVESISDLGLKIYFLMENDKVNSLRNLLQYLLSAVILRE